MPENSVDIIISGAGPNGLMLACELALAGVHPIVLEKLSEPSAEPKANGLVGQVIRFLDMRGLYHEFGGAPGAPQAVPGYAFSGIPMSFAQLRDNPMYILMLPQPKLVRLLEKRAVELGVEIRWGHELTELVQRDGGVTVSVTGPDGDYDIDTTFLIGADGGKSVVRKRAGIDFPGSTFEDKITRIAHVSLPEELRTADGGVEIPGVGRLPFGHNRFERGVFVFAELEPGRPIIATTEFDTEPASADVAMTVAELRDSVRRVLGVDVPIQPPHGPGPHALRRTIGQNTRQAERYRDGAVFLVGDAAHVHSAMGGPGLNLGIQDVANLGWKLAAHVNGWGPTGLLDTYQSERYPVGERVMMHSLSQLALMSPGPEITALRKLFTELLETPANAAHIAHLLAGSDLHYDLGDPHPLAGRLVPELTVETEGRQARVTELLHQARPVLLVLADDNGFADIAEPWRDRIDTVIATSPEAPADALLIRPDGYVAWAGESGDDADRLRDALSRWFGAAPNS
ncbi:FAD-dependent monooxygenase [Nocardia sp. NBC_00565]|uniref:FAD-dependent monooxygenase n=1 Tax=Nocardia sp. NBC_00565 TaxID=2975993 RepID=UPI002E7FC563|nr:FAD-dependent monooxygenase [Nocardia sp. NBC_00565]WUC04549.1 FAD-dependent monooxygenase [Nocardia sp. NBC_00565]